MTRPFEDSRRLLGANLFFRAPGAVLELAGILPDDALIAAWRLRVRRATLRLGWGDTTAVARRHAEGASLALSAPCDQLFAATEVNEWALCASLLERDPHRWSGLERDLIAAALEEAADPASFLPPVLEEEAALARLQRLASDEAQPELVALLKAADRRGLGHVLDETTLTLGGGEGSWDFPLAELPAPSAVAWETLHDIPTALVTGSNGKTTTVRLLAACTRAEGWRTAYSSTDGVFLDASALEGGDYSGPLGARLALRTRQAEAAVLETARGGILRRGLAVSHADVAVVTNVSADHFGEYGIFNLDALADAKLTVAAVVSHSGLLVLNADDSRLHARMGMLASRFGRCPPLGWFAQDADLPTLQQHRDRGGSTCGGRDGRLVMFHQDAQHDLGPLAQMPLTLGASVPYNIANLAASALGAIALGVAPAVIAAVFARFGSDPRDNVGRLMRFDIGGVRVLLDYAHNPAGLRGLLGVARRQLGHHGRLGLLLGHAGNRQDEDIEALARAAAEFRPSLVVVKENEAHLRGRSPGEVPNLIRATLLESGLPESTLPVRMTEVEAARCALAWARPGDVLALPVHSAAARTEVIAILEEARSHQHPHDGGAPAGSQ